MQYVCLMLRSARQSCGSVTFWYGSESGSVPLTTGSGSVLFSSLTFKIPTELYFFPKFFCLFLFEGTFTPFSKIKKSKKNRRHQCFSYYFCLMLKGSGSIPLTNGSGSRRPKNIRRIRIRIRSTCARNPYKIYIN
jgi:hypothetical protein